MRPSFGNAGFGNRARGSRPYSQSFMYADLSTEEPLYYEEQPNTASSSQSNLVGAQTQEEKQEQVPFSASQLQYLKQLFQQPEQKSQSHDQATFGIY